jgi:hypothetical protein
MQVKSLKSVFSSSKTNNLLRAHVEFADTNKNLTVAHSNFHPELHFSCISRDLTTLNGNYVQTVEQLWSPAAAAIVHTRD